MVITSKNFLNNGKKIYILYNTYIYKKKITIKKKKRKKKKRKGKEKDRKW